MTGSRDEKLTRRVARGAGIAGAGYLVTQIVSLASYVVLARLITPAEFGQYAAASVVLGVGFLFTESGMLAALIHRRDRLEEAANTALISTLLSGALLSVLVAAGSPLVGLLFQSDRVAEVTLAMSGLFLLRTATVVPDALLERRLSFVRRAVVEPIAMVAFAIVAVVTTSLGAGVWGLVIALYASALVDGILAWTLARWRPTPRLASVSMWRELFGYGRHVIASGLIQRFGEYGDRILVGRFISTAALGQYSYAYRIATAPYLAVLSVGSHVLFPALAMVADDRWRFLRGFGRAMRMMLAVAFPAGLILVPLGMPLIVLVFGETWSDAGEAVVYMAGYSCANALLSVCLESAKAIGRPDALTRTHTTMSIATLAAMIILLPFGLNGVAAGLSIGSVVGAATAAYVFSRIYEVPLGSILEPAVKPLAASALMVATIYPLEHLLLRAADRPTAEGLAVLALEGVAAVAIYVVSLRILSPALVKEVSGVLRDAVPSRGSSPPVSNPGTGNA